VEPAAKKIIRETLAHLVPCSGGKPVALARTNLYLGRRDDVDAAVPLNQQTARCRLRLVSGWWEIERMDPSIDVRINNRTCEFGRVHPGDELSIGRARYRLEYDPPGSASDFAIAVLNMPGQRSVQPVDEPRPLSGERPVITQNQQKKSSPQAAPPMPPHGVSRPSRAMSLPQRTPESPVQKSAPPAVNGVLAHLVPIGGGIDFPIRKSEVIVGREKDCDVPLRVKTVSSVHCKLVLIDGYWRVIDLNSRNGVRVDGVPCKEAWVFPECRLTISDQRFQLDYTPSGPRPLQDAQAIDSKTSLMEKIGVNERELDRVLSRIGDQYPDDTQNRRRDLKADD
jgi:hypothetical protein